MSEQNKATARRFYDEVFNRGDINAIDQICTPDFKDHGALPGQAPGAEGMKQMFSAYVKAFPDLHVEIEDIIAERDVVAVRFSGSATHKGELFGTAATGKRINFNAIDWLRVKDGKVTDAWHQGDDTMALMRLGIKPPGM